MADDKDIILEAPGDLDHGDDNEAQVADEAPKRDLNINQPELKELIEEKIAKEERIVKEENAEEERPQDDVGEKADQKLDAQEEVIKNGPKLMRQLEWSFKRYISRMHLPVYDKV